MGRTKGESERRKGRLRGRLGGNFGIDWFVFEDL